MGAMTAPLREISARATALPYLFLTYTPGNKAAKLLTPLRYNVLQDHMMFILCLTVITYIAHMVSRRVQKQEGRMM